MLRRIAPLAIAYSLLAAVAGADTTLPLEARITAVDMFKNGNAVLTVEAALNGPGLYEWSEPPQVVHGAFWVETDTRLTVRSTQKEVESPGGELTGLQAYAGREVEVFVEGLDTPVRGTLILAPPAPPILSPPESSLIRPSAPDTHVVIRNRALGRDHLINPANIRMLIAAGEPQAAPPVKTKRRVLLFDVKEAPAGGGALRIRYMTQGLAWAPDYRVTLGADGAGVITQEALVINELADLNEVDARLISGFPNIPFTHVTSPLSGNAMAQFFNQLRSRSAAPESFMSNIDVVAQQRISAPTGVGGGLPAMGSMGDGADMHFQPIGALTLAKGDVLSILLDEKPITYERKIFWYLDAPQDNASEEFPETWRDKTGTPWDAVVFRNPFEHPMTTAPALLLEGGNIAGQSTSYWANPGAEVVLPATKSLAIETKFSEEEMPESRSEQVTIGGDRYLKIRMAAMISLTNHRTQPAQARIIKRFEGELDRATGEPAQRKLRTGAKEINPHTELTWDIAIAPDQQVELKYEYTLLRRI